MSFESWVLFGAMALGLVPLTAAAFTQRRAATAGLAMVVAAAAIPVA